MRMAARYFIQCFIFYYCMTKSGILERSILERSGITEEYYPITFMILYEKNAVITIAIFSGIFLFCLCRWRVMDGKQAMHR